MIMYGIWWVLDLSGYSFYILYKYLITMYTPENNNILYVNCDWKLKIIFKKPSFNSS